MQIPPNDRRVFTHVAQSELANACAISASNCGLLSRKMSLRLLLILGRGPSGSSGLGAVHQKYRLSLCELYKNFSGSVVCADRC